MAASVALLSDGFVTAPAVEEDEEAVPLSQSTQLLQRKKEMAAVQLELDKKKDEFLSRMRRCTEREEELAERQDAIKEQVRKFDKFLKENDAKRARALRKAGEEAKIREAREAERVALEAELLRQRAAQGEIEAALRNLERPEQFLARACEHSDYFEDIEAILRRHEVLEATHADLLARVKTSEEQTLQRREELHETRKRTQTEAL
ncbi:hypothetical protein EMIHUDRAFT_124082, partial [Emiliania huxleyi CCMP1516]|uniref:DUF4200 domain-containing protein n=3 Tax=Emiliania huxleyi TaxID=2903 RepID=A0A0D3J215_EMIH1